MWENILEGGYISEECDFPLSPREEGGRAYSLAG